MVGRSLFRWEVPNERSEPSVHCSSKRKVSPFPSLQQPSRIQEDSSEILPAVNLDRKDVLFYIGKSITRALISTGHVAELQQALDHASRTGREDLGSDGPWAIKSCYGPAFLPNESLQTAANSTEYGRSACGYRDEESIDGETVMSSQSESDIDAVHDLQSTVRILYHFISFL